MGEGIINSGIFDVAFFKNQTECECKKIWISDDRHKVMMIPHLAF